MTPFNFLLLALSTWRVANMLVEEDGPWMAFEHLRLKVGLRPAPCDDCIRETDPPGQMPGTLFACVWCMSVWIGAFFAGLFMLNRKAAKYVALPFALSAVACLLDRWGNK